MAASGSHCKLEEEALEVEMHAYQSFLLGLWSGPSSLPQ